MGPPKRVITLLGQNFSLVMGTNHSSYRLFAPNTGLQVALKNAYNPIGTLFSQVSKVMITLGCYQPYLRVRSVSAELQHGYRIVSRPTPCRILAPPRIANRR